MTHTTIDGAFAADRELRQTFRGGVLTPGHDRYDTERMSWHRTIDPRPAVIAEASSPGDMQAAVRAVREHALPLAIQSTGHGTLVPADGALLLRTSAMAGVDVDPVRRTARVEPGALWSDVIAEASRYGLAPLSGTPAIGVVGYTLGGGAGWLSREYGYAADSVTSIDMITADGDAATASTCENADLFWALRGGGGAFAAVTALEFTLYPVEQVYSGMAMYPVSRARELFTAYRDWATGEPDTANSGVMVMRLPDIEQLPDAVRGQTVAGLRIFATGADAEELTEALRTAAGEPLSGGFARMSFADAAAATPPPPPMAARQGFELLREVPDAAVDALLEYAEPDVSPSLLAVELRHWGGAMAAPPEDHGPVGHRDVPFSVTMTTAEGAPGGDAAGELAAMASRLRPYTTGGSFLNFQTDTSRTASAFTTADYAALVDLKATWDPDDVFGLTHTIPPARRDEEER